MTEKVEVKKDQETTTLNRRKRVPLTGFSRKFSIPKSLEEDPDWHYHWFNDTPGRIASAMEAGYEFVDRSLLVGNENVGDTNIHNQNTSLDSRICKQTREFAVYLMRQPMEFYKEDQQLRDAVADRIDDALSRSVIDSDQIDKTYHITSEYEA